jgi:hypothetical protein
MNFLKRTGLRKQTDRRQQGRAQQQSDKKPPRNHFPNPSVKDLFQSAFSPEVEALSIRFCGVDNALRFEISQEHHVTEITA